MRADGLSLAFWVALVAVTNLLPVSVGHAQLTLDIPLLLAVGILFGGTPAAVVAVLGAVDARELTRSISAVRAIFNRVQIALTVYLATLSFHSFEPSLSRPESAVAAMLMALFVDYVVNAGLVVAYLRLRDKVSLSYALSQVRIGPAAQFVATYMAYGAMALVLAYLARGPGYWAVLILMVPVLLAREVFVRWQEATLTSRQLGRLENLVSRMNSALLDERRDERLLLAAELHDAVLQDLIAASYSARRIDFLARSEPIPPIVLEEAGTIADATEAASRSMRRIILGLRTSPLGRDGLRQSLESLIRELQIGTGATLELRSNGNLDRLAPDVQFTAFVVAREGALNAVRHARASRISIVVEVLSSGFVEVEVADDGVGFDQHAVDPQLHFGIQLMHERLRNVRGDLQINTSVGKGTSLRARIPLEGLSPRSDGPSYANGPRLREPTPPPS